MKPKMPMNVDDGYKSGRAAMPHVMALNKDPSIGMKSNRQPKPQVSNLTAFAKGGAVKSAKACAKGGKVKMAAGGAAKVRKASPTPKPIKKVPYVNGG